MKILVTGANGFLGRSIVKQLSENKDLEITGLTRQTCDLEDYKQVQLFFKDTYFDCVIHCAVVGGRRASFSETLPQPFEIKKGIRNLTQINEEVAYHNLLMFDNLYKKKGYYKKFINLASGAEIDSTLSMLPYGLSKKYISNIVEASGNNFHSIRIWNIFGSDEEPTRFMKANILHYINHENMIIYKNKQMDFYYIDDFITLLKEHIYLDGPCFSDAVYGETIYTLLDIANMINSLDSYKVDIDIQEPTIMDYPYISNLLQVHHFHEIGLLNGIRRMFSELKYGE